MLNLKEIITEICRQEKRDEQVYADQYAFEGRLEAMGTSSSSEHEHKFNTGGKDMSSEKKPIMKKINDNQVSNTI